MECVIPNHAIRVFGKAIHCLSRIGDELYIEAKAEGLSLKTVNNARSAFSSFLFRPCFFRSYDDGRQGQDNSDETEDESLRCKISAKSCISVFRALSTLEKTVDWCRMSVDLQRNQLVFVFHCKHGIRKTHSLDFQECDPMQAVFTKELSPNFLAAPARLFSEVVTNFPNNLEEVTLSADPESTRLRNYIESDMDGGRDAHTEVSLLPNEFDEYQIGVDLSVTFCLKELRAMLLFTDAFSHVLSLRFESAGKPIVLSLDDAPDYQADFVLATLFRGGAESQAPPTSLGSSHMATAGETTNLSIKTADEFSRMESRSVSASSSMPPPPHPSSISKGRGQGRSRGKASESNSRHRFPAGERKRGQGSENSRPPGEGLVPEPPTTDFMDFDGFRPRPLSPREETVLSGSRRGDDSGDGVAVNGSVATTTAPKRRARGEAMSQGLVGDSAHVRGSDPMDAIFGAKPDVSLDRDDGHSYSFEHAGGNKERRRSVKRSDDETGGVAGAGLGASPETEGLGEARPVADVTLADEEFFADDFPYQDMFVKKTPQATSAVTGDKLVGGVDRRVSESDSSMLPHGECSVVASGMTQDSIFNDSAFLPTTPPSKKFKSSLFGLCGLDQSEVLAPDSEDDSD